MEVTHNSLYGGHYSGTQSHQVDKRLEKVLEDYLPIIQEKLPALPLKKQMPSSSSIVVINKKKHPKLYSTISKLYQAAISPDILAAYDESVLEKLIYPSLFSRNILIKYAQPKDLAQITQKSLNYNGVDSSFAKLINSSGKLSNDQGLVESALVLISANREKDCLREIYGSIHYICHSDHYFVNSIIIDDSKKRCKYGTLLLGAAILEAKAKGLNEFKLWSVEESLFFYLNLGFLPDEVLEQEDYGWWTSASLAAKVHIIEKAELFPLTLAIKKNECLLRQKIKAALNFEGDDVGVEEEERVSSKILSLPIEAFQLGWLNKEDYQDREDIQIHDTKAS